MNAPDAPDLNPAATAVASSTRKAPRRTAQRILETTLALFNRYGEPNVSTTLISAELKISPGNLYYHYPAKEELVNTLVGRYEVALADTLQRAGPASDAGGAWQLVPDLLRLGWDYRFIFRDLNDLLTRNRQLETRCQAALALQQVAVRERVTWLCEVDGTPLEPDAAEALSTSVLVLLTYWLSFEYVRDPRHALEPDNADNAVRRGTRQVMALLWPYLSPAHRQQLRPATLAE